MTVAVTASSGRLGHAILRELAAQIGVANVVAVARSPERVRLPLIQKREGDYHSVESMAGALRGIDTTIMISAPVAGGSDRVLLHRNVIEAARRAGVRRVLFTSVIGNGREEGTLFFATQQVNRQTEVDLQQSGLEWVIGRNGLYLELDLEQMIRANAVGVYSNPGGEGRCGYITLEELACAYARLGSDDRHHGNTYNLVGEGKTQAELVELANSVCGLNLRYETITDDACIEKFRKLMPERGEAVARMLTGAFQCIRAGAFDVPSDFEAAAGRPAKPVAEMMEDCRRKRLERA